MNKSEVESEKLIQEINVLKARNAELESSFKRLEQIQFDTVQNAPMAIAFGYPDGRLENCNLAFSQLTGYSLEELQEIDWNKVLTPPKWNEAESKVLSKLRPENNFVRYEKEYIHKTGKIIPVELVVNGKFDENNKLIHFIGYLTDISDRKKAESDIRNKEKQLRTVVESAGDAMFLADYETKRIILANQEACASLGYTNEEFLLLKVTELDPTYSSDEDLTQLWDSMKIEVPVTIETKHKRKDGSIFPVEVRTVLILYNEKKTILGFSRDITERKRVEIELQEKRDRLASIVEGTNAGTWEWNIETGELELNEQWATMLGCTLKDLEPIDVNTWINNVHPDELPHANATLEKLFKKEIDYYDVEFRSPHRSGKWIWVNARGKITEWSDEGKPLRMSGTHLDITNRKEAEITLKNEKDRIRTILDMVGDPIFLKDNDHRIIMANRAFYKLFGLNEKKVIGYTLVEAVPEIERNHFLKVDRVVLDTGTPDLREEKLTIGEQTRTIVTRKIRFTDDAGNNFLVGSIHDVSDRKIAEEELKNHRDHLEELVKERTHDLETKNKELDNTMKVFVGREMTIRKLQDRIKALEGK